MCHQFKCKFISFTLEEESVASTTVTVDRPNAFAIMMKAAHTVMLPKSHESTAEPLRGYSHQEAKELDSKRKSLLINGKVRRTITCRECFKPRCIYASQKLNKHETALLVELDDSRLYTCGSHLFPPSSSHYESIVVRASLSCTDPVEVQYYSATLVNFVQVCYYCGLDEGLVEDDAIKELRKQFATVRPICFLCRSGGK